ncbi:hypothetical protein MTO96_017584 [Rhipicephalus appendiculatus]
MSPKIRPAAEELDSEELNRRIPGLSLNVPCRGKGVGREDGGSVPTSICHVFDNLSRWNYVLWHVGLQLRELRAPGRLCLHSCVESLHLDNTLIEGSGLGEYRECVVSTLRKNVSLRTLIIGSLFCEYKSIREELFGAVATMTNLRELAVLGSGAAPSVLVDAVCTLLVNTTCLTTLTIPRLIYDEASGTHLVTALRRNKTIENLSLHSSIVHSYVPSGISRFSHFLANSTRLTSLSVEGVNMDRASTFKDIKSIVVPFCIRGNLQKLRLTGFLLCSQCACLFAALATGEKGCLESLDISGCHWRLKSPIELARDAGATDGEQSGRLGLAHYNCRWIQVFDPTKPVHLSFLALSIEGLEPEHLRPLLNAALAVKSLETVSLSGVALEKLKAVCRVIEETSMSGRVRIEDAYIVDSSALADLREYPEALSKVAIRSFTERTPRVFEIAVRLACSWYRVTVLNLRLTQDVLLDVPTFRALCDCLRTAVSLRALSLTGCDEPDLSRTVQSEGRTHSVLLEMIFKNLAIRALRLNGLRLGDDNLRFLVAGVVASKSLCELAFASWNQAENDRFIRLLAFTFGASETITYLRLLASTDCVGDEWFFIENTIGHNMGLLTCAAHYVLGKDYSPRCEDAFAGVSGTNALKKRAEEIMKDGESTGNY